MSEDYLNSFKKKRVFEKGFFSSETKPRGTGILLGQIAIKKGLINTAQLSDALVEQKNSGEQLGAILLRKKFITQEQLEDLTKEQARIAHVKEQDVNRIQLLCKGCSASILVETVDKSRVFRCPKCGGIMVFAGESVTITDHDTTGIHDATTELSDEVRNAIVEKKNIVGKYVLLNNIGGGGGGEVYRAFDLVLERIVALKLFPVSSDVDLQRTRVEAQLCARLKHPAIPQIHEVGNEGSIHYMAMELVDGRNLHGVFLDLQEALRVTRDIALVLDYAHSRGIVHRDVKPSNLMVDNSGKVFLTDFGIAKVVEGAGSMQHTRSGIIKGTPQFMSPEQAMCDSAAIDARTDIYSLGATMYYLVTHMVPVDGNDLVEIVKKITQDEPRPPRRIRPDIPAEVEAIIQKAMSREKGGRYRTAKDMADDIGRFLAGEATTARPPSTARKMLITIRKKRKPIGVAVAAVAVIAAILIFVLFEKEKRSAAEAETRKQKEVSDKLVNTFLDQLSKLHLRAIEMRRKGARNDELRLMVESGTQLYSQLRDMHIRDARVHYSLGRLYRIIGDDKRAEAELSLAFDLPDARFEMGIIQALQYISEMEDLHQEWLRRESEKRFKFGGGLPQRPPDRELESGQAKSLRESCVKNIGASDAGRGIAAYVNGNRDEAEKLFKESLDDDAKLFLAEIYLASGRFSNVVELLTPAIEADKGNSAYFFKRGQVHHWFAIMRLNSGQDPGEMFERSIADFSEATRLRSEDIEAWTWRGIEYMDWGIYKRRRGLDPASDYSKAESDFEQAVKLSASGRRSARPWINRGNIRINMGWNLQASGKDPSQKYAQSIEDYEEAAKIGGVSYDTAKNLGGVRLNWGLYKNHTGENPTENYLAAIKSFEQAIKLNAAGIEAWMSRGIAFMNLGAFKQDHGDDPAEMYENARADYNEALRIAPNDAAVHHWRGTLLSNWANFDQKSGRDPEQLYVDAIADLEASIAANPSHAEVLVSCGYARTRLANYRIGKGQKADDVLKAAIADFDSAIKVNSVDAEPFWRRGLCFYYLGKFKEACVDFERAYKIRPDSSSSFQSFWNDAQNKLGDY